MNSDSAPSSYFS